LSFESLRAYGRAGSLLIIISVIASFAWPILSLFNTLSILFSPRNAPSSVPPFLFPYFIYLPLIVLLSLAGGILFLVAMNGFANYYKDRAIFGNVIYGVVTSIVGTIMILGVFFAFVFTILVSPTNATTVASLTTSMLPAQTTPPISQAYFSIIGIFLLAWLGAVAVAVIQNLFFKRAFDHLAEKSGEQRFRDAGLLMLIGGALTIILIGGIIVFVAWILVTIGFFSMKKSASQTNSPPFA
jgi:uncharacterized membrane protein